MLFILQLAHLTFITVCQAHFYQKQLDSCVSSYAAYKNTDDVVGKMMKPYLKLRQACDHPQVGSHGIGRQLGSTLKPLTLSMIKAQLIAQQRLETEDAHRAIIGCKAVSFLPIKVIDSYFDLLYVP